MKKGKIFGKKQLLLAVMVLALGGAIWLNPQLHQRRGGKDSFQTADRNGQAGDCENF